MPLIFVTGGARSGKSGWAERLAQKASEKEKGKVLYVATAEARDWEMRLRVAEHRKARPRSWRTIEAPTGVAATLLRRGKITPGTVLILDCVTMLASNLMTGENANDDTDNPEEKAEQALQAELRAILRLTTERQATIIMVTNEVGGGIVPENALARRYRDVVGRTNQWLAAQADEVWHVVSGMALPLHRIGIPVKR